jgi:ribose 5-phosphate isomerase B
MITLYVASDHAGFELKKQILEHYAKLLKTEISLIDLGPFSNESVDYPDYADLVCLKLKDTWMNSEIELPEPLVNKRLDLGVLICGSGQGMAIRANKFSYIRAGLVYNSEMAQLSRQHNNANVICLGSRFCSLEQALLWIDIFKKTSFAGGRHQTRVAKTYKPIP